MKVDYQQRIRESSEELYEMIKEQNSIKNLQKVQALYRLKSRYSLTVRTCADQMQVSQSSINRWLKEYQAGGIEKLLAIKPKTGRAKKIEPAIAAGIKKRIEQETDGFSSYKEIQKWVKEEYDRNHAYGTIYDLVRQRWRAKLKVPRPRSIKQDPIAKEEFEAYYLYGAIAPDTGESFFLEFPYLNGDCFQIFLDNLAQDNSDNLNVIQLDNGRFHWAANLKVSENVLLLFQPPYCPELNPIERLW